MIRTIAALALAVLPALAAARELPPGTFEVGAGTNLSFGSAKTEVNGTELMDTSSTAFSGDGLFYLARNVGLGLGLSYDHTKVETPTGSTSESTQWMFGPELKVNVPLAPATSLLLVGALGRTKLDEDGAEADGWAWEVGAGLRLFPAEFVSLDVLLDYSHAGVTDDAGNDYTAAGWNVGVGFSLYFGGQ